MTRHYLRGMGLVLTLCALGLPIAGAQTPWTVTVTPTMNPLPPGIPKSFGVLAMSDTPDPKPANNYLEKTLP